MTRSLPIICLLASLLPACADGEVPIETGYASVRERLEHEPARLHVASARSAGSIRAERIVDFGEDEWESGVVVLSIDSGSLVLRAAGNAILVEDFTLGIAPIELPEELVGTSTRLVDVRAELVEPVLARATWTADDSEARVSTMVKLDLSWALAVDDTTISLGAPRLPPLPLELVLTGSGELAHAEARIRAAGEIWGWADLVRLVDLFVLVGADG